MFTSVFLSRARTVRECVFLFLFVHFHFCLKAVYMSKSSLHNVVF